jgi:hypothetical protein
MIIKRKVGINEDDGNRENDNYARWKKENPGCKKTYQYSLHVFPNLFQSDAQLFRNLANNGISFDILSCV